MLQTEKFSLDVACNEPRSGQFYGCAPQLQVGDAEFEAVSKTVPAFTLSGSVMKISGKPFNYISSSAWVGNWCWDRFFVTEKTVLEILAWLNKRQNFQLIASASAFADVWDGDFDDKAALSKLSFC